MTGLLVKYQQEWQGKVWDQSYSNFQSKALKKKKKISGLNSIFLALIIQFLAPLLNPYVQSHPLISLANSHISVLHHLAPERLLLAIMFLSFFKFCVDYFSIEWESGTVWQEKSLNFHTPPLHCSISVLVHRQPIFLHPSEFRIYNLVVFFLGYILHYRRNTNIFKFLYKIVKRHNGHPYQ